MTVGDLIHKERLAKRMTKRELSERSSVDTSQICRYESNRRTDLRLSTLLLLAEALEVPVERLIPACQREHGDEAPAGG